MNKKSISGLVLFLPLFIFSLFSFHQPVLASAGCVPVYGGGVQCPRVGEVLVDKKVRNPATGAYVDNLGPEDPKYRPQTIVTFQITVKNTGDETLSDIEVTDTLPSYVDFMNGQGNYDKSLKKLIFHVKDLTPNSNQSFYINARVAHQAQLPADRNVICPTNDNPQPINVVDAKSTSGQTDRDESRFCIEKEVIVPKVPEAGPEHWILTFIGLSSAFIIGQSLRKKALN